MEDKKLHIAINCGEEDRVIYSLDEGQTIVIGCFQGSPDQARKAIKAKYDNPADYLAKVDECVKGTTDVDQFVNDNDWQVRRAVAQQGYGLEQLVNDENWAVRVAVAQQGYGLKQLVNDENCLVREAVAQQGYGLEQLVNDENWAVRVAVANRESAAQYESDNSTTD